MREETSYSRFIPDPLSFLLPRGGCPEAREASESFGGILDDE